eukprot:608217-Rhodomonas_salina.1
MVLPKETRTACSDCNHSAAFVQTQRKRWLSTSPPGFPVMAVGDEFELERTFSQVGRPPIVIQVRDFWRSDMPCCYQEDVDLFSRVSLDANPLHTEGQLR